MDGIPSLSYMPVTYCNSLSFEVVNTVSPTSACSMYPSAVRDLTENVFSLALVVHASSASTTSASTREYSGTLVVFETSEL